MTTLSMIFQDGHREALLTATSAAGVLAIENTQNDSRALVWRSELSSAGSALSQDISAIMPVTIDGNGGIAVAYTNLTLDATVTATLKNGMATVATVALECIETNLDGTTTWWALFNDGPIDQYDLAIDDPTNLDGYLQIARIICGPAIVTEYCLPRDTGLEYIEDVEHMITDALSVRSEGTGVIKRLASLNLSLLSTAERAALVETLRNDGMASAVFISIYDGWGASLESAGAFVAKRMGQFGFTHWINTRHRVGLEFREV